VRYPLAEVRYDSAQIIHRIGSKKPWARLVILVLLGFELLIPNPLGAFV
jgi:hypothetical protein